MSPHFSAALLLVFTAALLGTNWWVRDGLLWVPCGPALTRKVHGRSDENWVKDLELQSPVVFADSATFRRYVHICTTFGQICFQTSWFIVRFAHFALCCFEFSLHRGGAQSAWQPRLCKEGLETRERRVELEVSVQL